MDRLSRILLRAVILLCVALHAALAAQPATPPGTPPPSNQQANTVNVNPGGNPSPGVAAGGAFESQMLVFASAEKVAAHIAARLCKNTAIPALQTVVLYDQPTYSALAAFRTYRANVQAIGSYYSSLVRNSPVPSTPAGWDKAQVKLVAAGAEINTTLELDIGKFETGALISAQSIEYALPALPTLLSTFIPIVASATNTVAAQAVAISDTSFQLELWKQVARLRKPPDSCTLDLLLPALAQGPVGDIDQATGAFARSLRAVLDIRSIVATYYSRPAASPATTAYDPTALDTITPALILGLAAIDPATGLSGTALVIQGISLRAFLNCGDAATLIASVAVSGGTQKDIKNLWLSLTVGDLFRFSGGIVVNYALIPFDQFGVAAEPMDAAVYRYRTDFTALKDPSDVSNLNAGDNLGGP